jgi:monovalent cation:H+ antiporter-2, CPA2 family
MPIFPIAAASGPEVAFLFMELGLIFLTLTIAARLSQIIGLSPIPLYLLVGMAFGVEGVLPVNFSEAFIAAGAEIGVLLLLFILGLEYTAPELASSMRTGFRAGLVDIVLNFTPGFALGLILGWDFVMALLLGGVTYISSSGIISKLLSDFGWLGNRESPAILSVLIFEDLVMAFYLPLMTVLLVGDSLLSGLTSLVISTVTVLIIGAFAIFGGERLSKVIDSRNSEVLLLGVLALMLLVGGIAQYFQVSAAVGAFLAGIALSRKLSEHVHELIAPLRDMFAAVFFVFFGLQISPSSIPPVLLLALGLGAVSAVTKFFTGVYAARSIGVFTRGQIRAGAMLTIRGEFSIVIAGLASSAAVVEPMLAPLTAAYVLVMAIFGPIMLRFLDPIMNVVLPPTTLKTQTVPVVYAPPPGNDDNKPVTIATLERTIDDD